MGRSRKRPRAPKSNKLPPITEEGSVVRRKEPRPKSPEKQETLPDISQLSLQPRVDPELLALRRENNQLKAERDCRICRDHEANRLVMPCGHLALCFRCSPAVTRCVCCNGPIRGIMTIFRT